MTMTLMDGSAPLRGPDDEDAVALGQQGAVLRHQLPRQRG